MNGKTDPVRTPNLFDFATSELSHDAFIAWIINWANPLYGDINPNLHNLGSTLLKSILQKHDINNISIRDVRVSRQVMNIDVLILVNFGDSDTMKVYPDSYAIIIENKLFTKLHSDQLNRYSEKLLNWNEVKLERDHIIGIYYKIHDESFDHRVDSSGFKYFTRGDILRVFNNVSVPTENDSISGNYYQYITALEKQISSFDTILVKEWNNLQWHGFLSWLEVVLNEKYGDEMKGSGWGYVANRSGGFMGYWFGGRGEYGRSHYLQIESTILCIKQEAEGQPKEIKDRLKWEWMSQVLKTAEQLKIPFKRPSRVVTGNWFTVARYYSGNQDDDTGWIPVNEDGILNKERSLNIIDDAMVVLDRAHKEWLENTKTEVIDGKVRLKNSDI